MNSSSGDSVIVAQGLVKSFPSGDGRIDVLEGVDFSLEPGETVSIRGESGSGKTTLLNLMGGLERADKGSVIWAGRAINGLRSGTLARMRAPFLGMVFQAFYLIPELNALDNVLMSARILGRVSKGERQRASELLGRVGLRKRGHHLTSHLSGGERQRVALARALMNRPRLVLADEPTGNLDEKTGNGVIDLLLNLCREEGVSMVLVTHNKEHAQRTDRQLFLHLGRLTELAPPDNGDESNG